MTTVYLGVGSNLGGRYKNIETARQLLEQRMISVKRVSPLYETEAVCKPGQSMPPFVNGVFEIETDLSPDELLKSLEGVEKIMGRNHKGDWGPRPIDLDILFYGDSVVESERLRIPHPEIANRWFILRPLADLAPDLKHPMLGKTIHDLLRNIP